VEHIQNGLGLGEIDAAMKESTLREFAWAGHSGATFLEGLEDGLHHERVAVTADFDKILTGVGAGARPKGQHSLIQHLAFQA
jgi:hypothetical protein